jgi:cellulose synthase/poly-beta-1,6-N-acetylglucosamine synthase-like glycosyltransferase
MKPRALNIALSSARGELLAVYDAEDAPAPDQLRLAASRFAADNGIDCLQARLAVRNHDESWLSNGIMLLTQPYLRGTAEGTGGIRSSKSSSLVSTLTSDFSTVPT